MMPYFSLILPCYNVEKYVARCVQSILNQDFEDYEVILVDDGSTDGTPALCDALAAEHGRIRVIHKKNGGAASARNAGLEAAQGKYVWFVDADDWISPGSFKALFQAGETALPDVIKFNYNRIDSEVREVISKIDNGLYAGRDFDLLCEMAYYQPGRFGMSGCMHVYNRRMLNKHSIRFVSERDIGSEDVLFLLQALFHAENLYMICQPMYNYSCNTGSLSQVYNPGIIKRYVAFREYMLGYLRKCQASRKYFAMLECFFLGRLVIGTCITQEYYTVPQWHTMHDARAAVKRLLQMHEVQRSVKGANRSGMTRSKRAQLLALRLRIEPFFYWLYVTKPARKEG